MRGPLPRGAHAFPLFKNPPSRPLDEALGSPPQPVPADEFTVPQQGTWTDGWPFPLPAIPSPPPPLLPAPPRIRREFRRAVAALPSHLDPEFYRAVPAVTIETAVKVDWSVTIENGECTSRRGSTNAPCCRPIYWTIGGSGRISRSPGCGCATRSPSE